MLKFRIVLLSAAAAVALVGLGVAAPGSAAAASKTITVATSGSDQAAGTVAAPLRTIQAAIKRLGSGGTVDVRGGRYFQRVDLTGTTGVTVEAFNHEHVILDGSQFKPADGRSAM